LHELGHAVRAEPAHRILAMLAYGERADAKPSGDFLARQPVGNQADYLDLARPQSGSRARKTLAL
jgi:hypothetical protein